MKRKTPWRLAGTGAVAMLVLAGLLLLLANLYVQSHGVQERLRGELSGALRMPVALRKTTFTPWEGLRIDGIRASPAGNGGEVQLSAESFRARLALWALVSERRVVVRDVLFDRPVLAWTQTEAGHWRWPEGSRPVPAAPEDDADPAEEAAPGTAPAPTPAPVAAAPPPARAPRARGLPALVENIRLRHGRLEFRDRRGGAVARCEDVNADGTMAATEQGRGTLWMRRAAWAGGSAGAEDLLTLDDFRAPFTFDGEVLRLTGGRGRLAAGDVRLDGSLRPRDPGTPFATHGNLDNLSLAALLNRTGLRFEQVAGQVAGDFTASGLAADPGTHVGQGHLSIAGGELLGVPLLTSVGEVLGIEDLRRLKFDDAHADVSLANGNLRLEPLVLASRSLRVDARGDAHLHGDAAREPNALDVQARLTLNRNLTRQLPQFVENNFTPVPDSAEGARYLDFHVGGPLGSPRTDLIERAIGKGSLRGMLEDFFGGDKPKEKKKKPK